MGGVGFARVLLPTLAPPLTSPPPRPSFEGDPTVAPSKYTVSPSERALKAEGLFPPPLICNFLACESVSKAPFFCFQSNVIRGEHGFFFLQEPQPAQGTGRCVCVRVCV